MATKQTIDILNSLLEKNSDAEKGFAKASENATAQSLIKWFIVRKDEKKVFTKELSDEIHSYGFPSVKTPSLTGDLHRIWMDFKTMVSTDNDEVIIEEVIRGEKAALDEYNHILSEINFPSHTEVILKKHKAKIEHGLALLETLDTIEFQE